MLYLHNPKTGSWSLYRVQALEDVCAYKRYMSEFGVCVDIYYLD